MTIRPAHAVDAPAIAAINVETWRAAYRGQMPDAVLDGLNVERSTAAWTKQIGEPAGLVLVAVAEEAVIGYCLLIPSRDQDANPQSVGEIAAIYVQPRHWRQGAGRALSAGALAPARERGCQTVTLWVLASNNAAHCFYEKMGFRPDDAVKTFKTKDGNELPEVRFRITL